MGCSMSKLRRLRDERGYTQKQLGDKAGGLTASMVSYLVSGKRLGSLSTALGLADALGVTVNELVGEPAGCVPAAGRSPRRRDGACYAG